MQYIIMIGPSRCVYKVRTFVVVHSSSVRYFSKLFSQWKFVMSKGKKRRKKKCYHTSKHLAFIGF